MLLLLYHRSLSLKQKKEPSSDNTISKEVDSPTSEKVASDSVANRAPGMAASEVKAAPVIARRSTGRFMDVVRPSSVGAIQKPVAPAPSRTGTTIQPSPDLVDVISINNRHSAVGKEMSDMIAQSDNLSDTPDLKDVTQLNLLLRRLKMRPLRSCR